MYLDLKPWTGKYFKVNLNQVLGVGVREMPKVDKDKKPILNAEGKPIVDFSAEIMTAPITFKIAFKTEQEAVDFLDGNVVNA